MSLDNAMTQFKLHNDEIAGAEDFGREVLFEVKPVGHAVQVTAIDVITGVEVTMIAAANLTPYSLKMNAMRKLAHALSKLGEDDPPTKVQRRGHYA